MSNSYGYPPEPKECEQVTSPGLTTEIDHGVLNPGSPLVEELLGMPVPAASIARQILRAFPNRSVSMRIPGYGVFRVSEKGWCVE